MNASELHGRTLLVVNYEDGGPDSAQYRFLRGRGHSQATGFLVIARNNAATSIAEDRLAAARPLDAPLRQVLLDFLAEEMLTDVEYFISNPPRDTDGYDEGYTIYTPLEPRHPAAG